MRCGFCQETAKLIPRPCIFMLHSLGSVCEESTEAKERLHIHADYVLTTMYHTKQLLSPPTGRQIQIFDEKSQISKVAEKSSLHSVVTLSDHITFRTQSNASYGDKPTLLLHKTTA